MATCIAVSMTATDRSVTLMLTASRSRQRHGGHASERQAVKAAHPFRTATPDLRRRISVRPFVWLCYSSHVAQGELSQKVPICLFRKRLFRGEKWHGLHWSFSQL